jgi:3-oxoacyl-[acyl-carrier-protein] synthase II
VTQGFRTRIVITGTGAVTAAGANPSALWQALVDGRSGVQNDPELAAAGARPAYAAPVRMTPEEAGVPRKRLKMMGRPAQLAYAAAGQACAEGGILADGAVNKARFGVILGVGMLNADVEQLGRAFHATAKGATNGSFHLADFGRFGAPELFPLWLLRHIPNLAAAHASISLEAQGPSNTISTGCVAAANAIGEAARIIARGEADAMLAGGERSLRRERERLRQR